jgi:pyrroloquinoline quinone biosynthesis protein D
MLLVPEGALRLKGAAREIIGFIDGARSVDAITLQLQQIHAAADAKQIEDEVRQFLEKLHKRSILHFRSQIKVPEID